MNYIDVTNAGLLAVVGLLLAIDQGKQWVWMNDNASVVTVAESRVVNKPTPDDDLVVEVKSKIHRSCGGRLIADIADENGQLWPLANWDITGPKTQLYSDDAEWIMQRFVLPLQSDYLAFGVTGGLCYSYRITLDFDCNPFGKPDPIALDPIEFCVAAKGE